MRKIMVKLLLVMSLALPIFVHAQEVDTPTPDVATLEATQTADVVTATPSPTEEATPEPTPIPVPPPPAPIDLNVVLPWVLTIGIVAIAAFVTIAWVGIVQAAKGLPEWSRPILLSNIKTGIDALDNLTDGPVADAGIAELRRMYAKLEAELNKTQAELRATQRDVADNAQALAVVTQNK